MGKIFKYSGALTIIGITAIVFIIQLILGNGFTEAFLLNSAEVWSRPWILITSMFLHADPSHFLFNMYALFLFGPLIESRIGTKRFYLIYFLSGLLAATASIFFYDKALGASGAIMGILGVTIMLMPDLRVFFLFFIPMSLRTAGIIFALIDIFGIFVPSNVANIAHLGGLSAGLIYGYYLLKKRKIFQAKFQEPQSTTPATKFKSRKNNKSIELSEDEIQEYIKNGKL